MRVIARSHLKIAAVVVALLATACSNQNQEASVTLDAGTELRVAPLAALSPATEQAGDEFTATLAAPLIKGEEVIAPQGATVTGEVVDAQLGGPGEQGAFLSLELKEIVVNGGQAVAVKTEPVRYVPAGHEQAGGAAAPSVAPEDATVTFRLAEPVDVPLAIPDESKPTPIS